MEGRVFKKEGKYYLELPAEFSGFSGIELFPLREGYYLLTTQLGPQMGQTEPVGLKTMPKPALTPEEKELLRTLFNIRFDQRTPARVEKLLGEKHKSLLENLLAKGYVNVFKSRKYPEGVYNISDRVYSSGGASVAMASAPPSYPSTSRASSLPTAETKASGPPSKVSSADPLSSLLSEGYTVIDNARLAAEFSDRLRQQGKSNSVTGIKGFDGKFYAVTKTYLAKATPLVLHALEEPHDVESIAKICKLPPAACMAILHVLSEQGDVVEKRKGVFVGV